MHTGVRKPRPAERGQSIEPTLLVSFVVPGEPVPKARPRFARGRTYTPKETVEAEDRLRRYCFAANPGLRPVDGHIRVLCTFYLRGAGRGDLDNYLKLVCDALNSFVWHDDRQVTEADVKLVPYAKDEPHTFVSVWLIAVPASL